MSLSPSAKKVQRFLEEKGFGHLRVVELTTSTRTAKEAAEAVGAEVGQIVKSLDFLGGNGAYLFLISGRNRLDPSKAQRATGEVPEELLALTGAQVADLKEA